MIVCGDIGGTKALLGIAEIVEGTPRFAFRQRYECAAYGSFDELFAAFRADAEAFAGSVKGGCLAVAGPVDDSGLAARITNLPWIVDGAHCGARFGLPPLVLVNDFAGAAAGVAAAAPEDLVTLQAGEPLLEGVRLVVGAGTGLGMAVLSGHGREMRVLPGEGGHVGFSPQDAVQSRIHAALLAEHGRVIAEHVISGPGLAAVHRILACEDIDAAVIAERALRGEPKAARSLDVFLAGGIAAKVMPALRVGGFLHAFYAKGVHSTLARRMPVHVVTDPELGLKGAALLA